MHKEHHWNKLCPWRPFLPTAAAAAGVLLVHLLPMTVLTLLLC
jgi:hypothetical protein